MKSKTPHIGIIMDGNGRWARRRGLPRTAGHNAGARAARSIVEAAAAAGIGTLTLYAFSSDNWCRPETEVRNLMGLLGRYLTTETARCRRNDIKLTVIGRRDRLPAGVTRAVDAAELQTRGCAGMHLRLAVDYSATEAIVRAAARFRGTAGGVAAFTRALGVAIHSPDNLVPVDLLIRTGGEQRLSDFLLWECAYAELVFSAALWPDFGAQDLRAALADFAARRRRFGSLTAHAGARQAG